MANRFYTTDKTKWRRPAHISVAGQDPEKMVSHFIFDADSNVSVARLGTSFEEADAVVAAALEQKQKIQATGRYTDLGVAEALGEHALTDALPRLRRASIAVERIEAEIEARRQKFVPAPPSATDVVGEMQRAEMRKMVRELPNETERNKYAIEHADDPAFVAAVIHAPAGLSGLSPSTHGLLRDGQIEREHGEAIAELGDLEEVAGVARKAVRNARSKLQEIVGVGPEVFEKIAIVAEKNGGKLPFRVDVEQAPNGQPIEVARVFDLESKQWRRATAEEIQASANDAAAA